MRGLATPGADSRMKVFFFGLGYCARQLIQREPWIEAEPGPRERPTP